MTTVKRGNRFIFVGGAPRSGTTLAQNMLDMHSDILGGPEFHHLERIIALRNFIQESVSDDLITDYCSREDVDDAIAKLIESLLLPLAEKYHAPYLSKKTPQNVFVFEELLDIFPESHCIFVVRDPRAVSASMLQVGQRAREKKTTVPFFTTDVRATIAFIQRCMDAGFGAAEKFPDRVFVLSYEALVADPESETRRICDFLGLEWQEDMLSPGSKKHLGLETMTGAQQNLWYDKKSFQRDPQTTELEKWRNQLKPHEIALLTQAFAGSEELRALGHGLNVADLSPAERGAAAFSQGYVQFKRGLRGVARKVLP